MTGQRQSYINVKFILCRLNFDKADPKTFVGLKCKARILFSITWVMSYVPLVPLSSFIQLRFMLACFLQVYWPLDIDWYSGCVESYDEETKLHHVMLSYLILYSSMI